MKYAVILLSIVIILQAIDPERIQSYMWKKAVARIAYFSGLGDAVDERQEIFQSAENYCSFCEDVHLIEKISKVDPKFFEERYAYSSRPVVVTDATSNWTAMEKFSFTFLKELYENRNVRMADCQFLSYLGEFGSLQEAFNMSTERALSQAGTKPWYIGWSNCDESIRAALRKFYQRPYFLPDGVENQKTDWLFMGSPGYGAPMHTDNVKNPSWQAQIRGRKTWILAPPRECELTCRRLEVTVNPGEIIVLETKKWFHETTVVSEDISITIGAEYTRIGSNVELPPSGSARSHELPRSSELERELKPSETI